MAIAFIPVRGGSKSIPLKNIKPFCGMPLVYWSIKALEKSSSIDKIIVATDSAEIKEVVLKFNFPKVEIYDRDAKNAPDMSSTEDVMLEYLSKHTLNKDESFVLVQATNPFTTSTDIDSAFKQMKAAHADSLLTCVRSKRFFWSENGLPINYDFKKRPRRQEFDGLLMENGAFYISACGNIIKDKNRLSGKIEIYEMPDYTSFEIDEPDDWLIMENLFQKYSVVDKIDVSYQFKPIKLFLSDVDGVMTDAGMYYSENGDELKKFDTHDGMGFQILRHAGIKTGLITTENTKIVERRAKKLRIDYVFQGKGFGSKLDAAKEICEIEKISLDEVAYIGDDINCIDIFKAVNIKACPSNAIEKVKELPGIIHLKKAGGNGAVREFVEWLIKNKYVPMQAEETASNQC